MQRRISSPKFVGRVDESRILDAALAEAGEGSPSTVLIGGEAGIGKTRLVTEFGRRAAAGGALVLVGGCVPLGRSGLPLGPFVEAIRRFLRALGPAELAGTVAALPELARILPELASSEEARALPPAARDESGQARLFEHLLEWLEELSSNRILVLVLEDLHWSDRSTRDLLMLRVQTARIPNCALVGTYRHDELTPGHPMRTFIAELDRTGRIHREDLSRFTREQVLDQLTGILGADPLKELVDSVFRRSEGNPFLAEELCAARDEEENPLPEGLSNILTARTAALSAPAQQVLRLVAAIGPNADHRLLSSIAAMPERDLLNALREAVAHHVIVTGEGDAYAFRHALTREALYADLLPGERMKLHSDIARRLEEHSGVDVSDPAVLTDIAQHWYAANDYSHAVRATIRAAHAIERFHAHAEALSLYERVLELWDHVDDPEAIVGGDRAEILGRAAEAASSLGESEHAVSLAGDALSELGPRADPIRVGLLYERLGRYAWIGGRADLALESLERSVEVLPADPTPERARVLAALGHVLVVMNRYRQSRTCCEEALSIARGVGARVEEGRAMAGIGADLAGMGRPEEGRGLVREGRAVLAEAGAPPDFIFITYAYESSLLEDAGRLEEAVDAALEGADVTRQGGLNRNHRTWVESNGIVCLIRLGRWDEAERLIDQAADRRPTGISRKHLLLARADLETRRGDLEGASRDLEDARQSIEGENPLAGRYYEVATNLALAVGDTSGARVGVDRGLEVFAAGDHALSAARLCWSGIRAEAERVDVAQAMKRADEVEESRSRAMKRLRIVEDLHSLQEAEAAAPELLVLVDVSRAEYARLVGTWDVDQWSAVVEGWGRLRRPWETAYAHWRLAEGLLATRAPKERVATALRAAHATAVDLGAAPLSTGIELLAQRSRIDVQERDVHRSTVEERARQSTSHTDGLGLTAREIQVLALVARGLTNKQIGEALFISSKTAGVHVSNILAKLGVARRVEAAAIAQRFGLLDDSADAR
jgi:DNA-binding CsgD family transcriptional regulator/tetratricopeptide (TPR) repeat protein